MEIGSIIIPKGFNKEDIKNLCFNEEKFFVMTNTRGMLDNVACIHQVVSDIEFPKDDDSLGSQVILEEIKGVSQFIIIGTLSKIGESSYNSEENLLCRKVYKGDNNNSFGNTVGLIGNTLLSRLSVFCKNVCKKTANLFIECFGDKDSKLELNSSGWILCKGEEGIRLRYKTEKEISIIKDQIEIFYSRNQTLTIKDKELIYKDGTNTFKIDESGYNLGNINFKNYIIEILDFLGNDAMLLTSCGPSSAGMLVTSAAPKLELLRQKIEQINN